MEARNSEYPLDTMEELYAKPYKKGRNPSADGNKPEQLYDRLDRGANIMAEQSEAKLPSISNEQLEHNYSKESVAPFQSNQSMRSNSSGELNQEHEAYKVEVLETKDTNDIVKEISDLGLESQSDRLITALRNRFELEGAFIDVCAKDGIIIVEGESDAAAANEHQSIGGLRVKGMRPNCVNYDEYDPDIICKYSLFAQGLSKEQMANDAADLRKRAANMLWAVENMERMIDPNSRVRYVRQEGEN